MPLSVLEQTTINRAIALARKVVEEVYPALKELNVSYNASGGVSSTITQTELDANPDLSGLTKAQLDDALYALTSGILGAIDTGYSQLVQLGTRQASN